MPAEPPADQAGSDRAARVAALPPAKRALLAELTRRRTEAGGPASLAGVVLLREGHDPAAAPIVLAHPIGGSLFCYADLCRQIAKGPAIWGVAAGPALAEPSDVTVEQLADRYVAALGRAGIAQAAALAGWSFGGLLGYEMARRWPGPAPAVVLIDSAPWPRDRAPWDQATTLRTFAEYLASLAGVALPSTTPGTLWQRPVPEALAGAADVLRAQGIDPGRAGAELTGRFWTYANAIAAMSSYRPGPPKGRAVLVRAAASAAEASPWPATAGGPPATVEVPGDHFSVLRPPGVRLVAQVIQEAIAVADQALPQRSLIAAL